jgi:hypothetical protein
MYLCVKNRPTEVFLSFLTEVKNQYLLMGWMRKIWLAVYYRFYKRINCIWQKIVPIVYTKICTYLVLYLIEF